MCLKCNPGARPCSACSTTREAPSSANRMPISTRASLRLRLRCNCLWRDVARRRRWKGGRGHLYSGWQVITPGGMGVFLKGKPSLPAVSHAGIQVPESYDLCIYLHNFYPCMHVYIHPSFYYPCMCFYLFIYQSIYLSIGQTIIDHLVHLRNGSKHINLFHPHKNPVR